MLSGVKSTYPSRHAEMTANADRKLCCGKVKSWAFMKLLQSNKKAFCIHVSIQKKCGDCMFVCFLLIELAVSNFFQN